MNMKTSIASSLLILGLGLSPIVSADYAQPRLFHDPFGAQRVIYQLNDGDQEKQIKTMKYALNHIETIGRAHIEMHIVLFDGGISVLQSDQVKVNTMVDELRANGVKFAVCNNTLKNKNIDYKTLRHVRETDVVPSGVAEIAFLQQRGYGYIKP